MTVVIDSFAVIPFVDRFHVTVDTPVDRPHFGEFSVSSEVEESPGRIPPSELLFRAYAGAQL